MDALQADKLHRQCVRSVLGSCQSAPEEQQDF